MFEIIKERTFVLSEELSLFNIEYIKEQDFKSIDELTFYFDKIYYQDSEDSTDMFVHYIHLSLDISKKLMLANKKSKFERIFFSCPSFDNGLDDLENKENIKNVIKFSREFNNLAREDMLNILRRSI